MADDPLTYLLVDGENIDGVLGGILKNKPDPSQRPRWQQVLEFAGRQWDRPVRALFFVNATRGLHASFMQALIAIGYRPIALAGRADEKVVDIGIRRTLEALRNRDGHVLLASHDGDFVEQMVALCEAPDRKVAVIAFTELVSQALREVPGVEIFDIEDDAKAFEIEVPRVRVIPLDKFDPTVFL